MATFPEQVFQNHMVHHPLLQYQMLFPSLLMSLGAPPNLNDDGDPTVDSEGHVDTVDYLRFSALSNQLAITQINQVLMDLVTETPADDIKKMTELQKSFIELVKKGFALMNQGMKESKAIVTTNTQVVRRQEDTLATLQDVVAKGFLESLSKTVALQETSKHLSNRTASEAKEFRGMLQSIGDSLLRIQNAVNNMTEDSLCCNITSTYLPEMTRRGITPPTIDIAQIIQNLTKTLGDFITSAEEAASERAILRDLMEKCANCSSSLEKKDANLDNITRLIDEGFANNLEKFQPHVLNISEDLGRFDTTLLKTQDDIKGMQDILATSFGKIESEFQELKKFTLDRFNKTISKIDSLYNSSVTLESDMKKSNCPEDFFALEDECFFLTTDDPVSKQDAENYCVSLDGHLAEPKSLLKFLALITDLDFNKTASIWMGGSKKRKQQQTGRENTGFQDYIWRWESTQKVIQHGWNANQPLNEGDCLMLYNFGLETSACDVERGFACKKIHLDNP